ERVGGGGGGGGGRGARGLGFEVAQRGARAPLRCGDPFAVDPPPRRARRSLLVDGVRDTRGQRDPFAPARGRGRREVGEGGDPERVQRVAQIGGPPRRARARAR